MYVLHNFLLEILINYFFNLSLSNKYPYKADKIAMHKEIKIRKNNSFYPYKGIYIYKKW